MSVKSPIKLIIWVLIILFIAFLGVREYHRIVPPPIPTKDTITVGTDQDPDTFYLENTGTTFKHTTNLIVEMLYNPKNKEFSKYYSIESECLVIRKDSGKMMQKNQWSDSIDTTSYYFNLNNQNWPAGDYVLKLYRLGNLDSTLEITLK